MTKKIFYEKVGRRYKPVYEYDSTLIDAYPKGTHIVICHPGGRSTRYNIDPAYAPMIAAGRVAEEGITTAIREASKLRCSTHGKKPVTESQRKAWKNLEKEMGVDSYPLEWPRYREIAEAGIKAMMDEAEKLMTNPAVKKAYEHFLLVCELTRENAINET